jgi:hypothetical protein
VTFRENGVHLPESHQWREYGKGWLFTGSGLGFSVAGTLVMASNAQPMPGLILVIDGAVLSIAGEVTWIKAMVHSSVYVSNAAQTITKKSDLSLFPFYDLKGKYGMVAQIGF